MLIKVETSNFHLPGSRDPTKWNGPFTFALLADPQKSDESFVVKTNPMSYFFLLLSPVTNALAAEARQNLGLFKNNHSWEEELQQVQDCIAASAALQPQPAFILVLGDLVHAPVPAHNSGPNAEAIRTVRDQQARDLQMVLDKPSGDVPVLVIAGNHDVGHQPTSAAIEDYEKIWGKANFSFWFGGIKFVVANSSLFYDDAASPEAAEEQFAWLEEEFKEGAEKNAKHIFLLQHHQFYWKRWAEADDNKTQIEVRQMKIHNVISTFQLPERWRRRFLPLLKKYKVGASFHGHLHSDSVLNDEEIQQIVTSSCGFATNDGRPGWRLVEVKETAFEHKFIPVEWRAKEYPFLPPRFA